MTSSVKTAAAVPAVAELGLLAQWVLWRYETRGGKRTKVPYAGPGRHAAVDNPQTWTTYDRAQAAAPEFDGLGFVFTGTAYCGLDLDHCVDDAGTMEPWARAIVQRFNSYTERSPSGLGAHILIRGRLPGEQRGRCRKGLGPGGAGGVELYSTGHYFTVTGDHLPETPTTIEARQSELERFVDEMFPPKPALARPMDSGRVEGLVLTDRALLDKATRAKNGEAFQRLWAGDWSGYGSQSEADLALCAHLAFWTRRDPERLDRLFRASGLMREKWDEQRGRDTYGALTIARALESAGAGYDPNARPTAAAPVSAPTVTAPEPSAGAMPPAPVAPPTLARDAYYGLAGRVAACIEPCSEADPAAILLHVLIGAGNLIGRSVYAMVESTRHCCNEFAVLVGESAKGRKGQAWSTPRALFDAVNPEWARTRVRSGLSSGEGLIYHVRDPREEQQPVKERGRVVDYQTVLVDPGEADKRLLLFEPELASVLRRMNGETSSLSAVLRQAWESGDLSTLTRRDALRATGAHISVIAHVTREELIANLTETEKANGFANRFLFCLVRRSKLLPDGGRVPEAALAPLLDELRAVATYAATPPRELRRTPEAAEMFRAIYPELSAGEPGLLGAVLARAEAHVLRLSLLYAALDCAPAVTPAHLEAALALWDFADASARAIFAGRSGIAEQDVLVTALHTRGRLTRTEISALFHRNKPAQQIDALLRLAEEGGRIRKVTAQPEGARGGRPVTTWEVVS
jgi:hypothetical protein